MDDNTNNSNNANITENLHNLNAENITRPVVEPADAQLLDFERDLESKSEEHASVASEKREILPTNALPIKGTNTVPLQYNLEKSAGKAYSFTKGILSLLKKVPSQTKKGFSGGDKMNDERVNQSAYWAFGQLLKSYQIEGLEKAMRHDLPAALKWFRITYAESPANGPWNLYIRIYLFQVLKSILNGIKRLNPKPDNTDQVQKIIMICLNMEPLNELIFTMMMDVSAWLQLYEGKMMYDSVIEGSILTYYIEAWECILEMPFETPDNLDVNHISNILSNIRSRTDMFSILLNAVDHLFNRVTWIRNQESEDILDDPGLRSLKKKIEWILNFILRKSHIINLKGVLQKTPPPLSLTGGFVDVCTRILNEPDEDPFSGVLDSARELMISLKSLMDTSLLRRTDTPPIAYSEKSIPYLFDMLKLKKNATKNDNVIMVSAFKVSDSTTSLNLSNLPYLKDDLLVSVDGIIFQVDTIIDRLVNSEDDPVARSAIFITPNPGRFILTKHSIMFMGRRASKIAYEYDPSNLALALKVPKNDIKLICKVGLETSSFDILKGDSDEETTFGRQKSTVSSIMRRRSKASVVKPKKKNTEGNQAVIIETFKEVYKFFPFTLNEANSIVDCISEICGIAATPLAEYIQQIVSNIKSRDRLKALQILSKESNPWIATTEELTECIASLAKENSEFSFITLERLYHSCRLEKKVTFEAIICLKEFMSGASSEAPMLKILLIADRILDKSIMTPGDDLFVAIQLWLKECQETISPFRYPKAGKALDNILKRCKAFSIEPLVPLGENIEFDYQHDYEYWLMFYNP